MPLMGLGTGFRADSRNYLIYHIYFKQLNYTYYAYKYNNTVVVQSTSCLVLVRSNYKLVSVTNKPGS